MSDQIKSLLQQVGGFEPGRPLKKFIGEIRFPNFKNLEPGTRVTFDHALTVLVGANGSGKSSILQALYGTPKGYSTGDFWFSTELDPIQEGGGLGPPRFIYTHWNEFANAFVETRKARVRSQDRLDYWEPTKIVRGDGMEPLPVGPRPPGAASDRWLPVERKVIHINAKAEISAFDRYFYFETGQTREVKHKAMLREAQRLKDVLETGRTSWILYGKPRVFENRPLTPEELQVVSFVLGHDYRGATLVRHTLYPGYRGQDISVLFEKPSHRYSEAFAGSGEVAVVSSVIKLLSADDYALVLLDEPETSLHPGAQRRYLEFLLRCIKKKKIQVVISTHSPEFVDGLPERAIKVLEATPSGHVTVSASASPLVAFNRLGSARNDRLRVIVEDELARQVVAASSELLDVGERDGLEIVVVPGGAEMILGHYVPAAMASNDRTFVLLDGDKEFEGEVPDPASLPATSDNSLAEMIVRTTGVEPRLYLNGGSDPNLAARRISAQRQYLGWLRERVRFLPRKTPEEIVIFAAFPEAASELSRGEDAKAVLYRNIERNRRGATASEIVTISAYLFREKIGLSEDARVIAEILRGFLRARQA